MRFLKKARATAIDTVWFTRSEKLAGITDAVTESLASGGKVLLLAHFKATRTELGSALDSSGIGHRVFDHPLDPGPFLSRLEARSSDGVILALSERISPYAVPVSGYDKGQALDIIVGERYPLEERDDLILKFGAMCGARGSVRFHSSLEDPMFKYFGSDRYTKVFRALGSDSTEPLTGTPITRAIRSAQKKIKRQAIGDQRVPSAEDWFAYNIRR